MSGRTRGCVWLIAGLVVALAAGLVGYMTLQRATVARTQQGPVNPPVPVVVAARAVAVRQALGAGDLQVKELPPEAVPQGAVREIDGAAGKITMVDLFAGEVVLQQRLVDPNQISGNGRMALAMAEDQVLMAFPAEDLMSKVGVLKPGDHVDLLFSVDFPTAGGQGGSEKKQSTFNLLQNVTIAAIVAEPPPVARQSSTAAQPTPTPAATAQPGGGPAGQPAAPASKPQAILLTVNPQDALLLKYAMDAKGTVDVVLRAPGAEGPFTVEPVDSDFMIRRYRIPTGGR
jgi:pilus assembly protein CpaB